MPLVAQKIVNNTSLKITGNIIYVLQGHVSTGVLHNIDYTNFRFALGSGTYTDPKVLGETLILEGKSYVSWVQDDKVVTEAKQPVKTPFLMGIDNYYAGGAFYNFNPGAPVSLQSLYEDLSNLHTDGFAILGHVIFSQFETTYLKKPPIFGENINDNTQEYWAQIPKEQNMTVVFFGVAIPAKAVNKYPQEMLMKGFYQNPNEKQKSKLLSHTHGALLGQMPLNQAENMEAFMESVKTLPVKSIRHLLTSSIIKEGSLAVFPIGQIESS